MRVKLNLLPRTRRGVSSQVMPNLPEHSWCYVCSGGASYHHILPHLLTVPGNAACKVVTVAFPQCFSLVENCDHYELVSFLPDDPVLTVSKKPVVAGLWCQCMALPGS